MSDNTNTNADPQPYTDNTQQEVQEIQEIDFVIEYGQSHPDPDKPVITGVVTPDRDLHTVKRRR
jgi:hypothetical protein